MAKKHQLFMKHHIFMEFSSQTPYHKVDAALRQAGFERGWGNTVSRARETMNMLADLLEATDADLLQVRVPLCHITNA